MRPPARVGRAGETPDPPEACYKCPSDNGWGISMVGRMLIAAGAVAIPVWTASAFCAKPIAPYCTTQYGQFSNQDASERCGSDLDFYRAEIESYQSCLQREQEEAVRELQEAVAGFRRRAGR